MLLFLGIIERLELNQFNQPQSHHHIVQREIPLLHRSKLPPNPSMAGLFFQAANNLAHGSAGNYELDDTGSILWCKDPHINPFVVADTYCVSAGDIPTGGGGGGGLIQPPQAPQRQQNGVPNCGGEFRLLDMYDGLTEPATGTRNNNDPAGSQDPVTTVSMVRPVDAAGRKRMRRSVADTRWSSTSSPQWTTHGLCSRNIHGVSSPRRPTRRAPSGRRSASPRSAAVRRGSEDIRLRVPGSRWQEEEPVDARVPPAAR